MSSVTSCSTFITDGLCGLASQLWTRPPGAQQEEQILNANVAAAVEVGGTITLLRTRPPGAQQEEKILHANVAAYVEIGGAGKGARIRRAVGAVTLIGSAERIAIILHLDGA